MSEKPDMRLHIGVVLNGRLDAHGTPSVRASYYQEFTDPPSSDVVQLSGDIRLLHMTHDPAHHNVDTDITFNLSGIIVDAHGNLVDFNFPHDPAKAVTITPVGHTNAQLTPRAGQGPMQIIIDDENNDSEEYSYCLAVEVGRPAPSGTVIKLDPSIVNR